jgi:hypothetical protein
MTGCYEYLGYTKTVRWAVVDKNSIRNILMDLSKRQNPYPKEIDADDSELGLKSRKLSRQISSINTNSKKRCEKNNQLKSVVSERGDTLIMPPTTARSYDYECIRRIEKDQLLVDLEEKKSSIDRILRSRRNHDGSVRKLVDETLIEIIKKYTVDDYDLIISHQSGNVLFNRNGIIINVTDVVISGIRKDSVKILL